MTTEEEISRNRDDRNEARRDLRDTLTEVSAKAEQQEEELRLDRLIESSPIGASCLAGALGFVIGSRAHPSAVGPAMIVACSATRSGDASRSMGVEAMEEKQHLTSNGAQETHADWATLVAQAVDDVSHILHAEADLLQMNLGAALRAQIDYAVTTFAMVVAFICATICTLAALILFLHQSFLWWHGFPWWEALAVGAFLMFVVGIAIRRISDEALR